MDDPDYTWLIIGTIVGFFALAALLLVPVYRFLNREEKVSEAWTKEAMRQSSAKNEE
ncbi:MAG: hypothetical protein AB8G77_23620 [Rhodothermales bacterium]